MSALEQITALLRESDDPKHRTDPDHYERKAAVFDAVATDSRSPQAAKDARMFADRARARAAELRAKGGRR